MDKLDQKIHDFVKGSAQPVNVNQIFQGLKDAEEEVTIEDVHQAVKRLESIDFLKDAHLPSYYANF